MSLGITRQDFGLVVIWATVAFLLLLFLSPIHQPYVPPQAPRIQVPNSQLGSRKDSQRAAIKIPKPGESTQFDISVYPEEWSVPVSLPPHYSFTFQITGRIWFMPNGDSSRAILISPNDNKQLGNDFNSMQFKSAETSPVTVRIRLDPYRSNDSSNHAQNPTDFSGSWVGRVTTVESTGRARAFNSTGINCSSGAGCPLRFGPQRRLSQ